MRARRQRISPDTKKLLCQSVFHTKARAVSPSSPPSAPSLKAPRGPLNSSIGRHENKWGPRSPSPSPDVKLPLGRVMPAGALHHSEALGRARDLIATALVGAIR